MEVCDQKAVTRALYTFTYVCLLWLGCFNPAQAQVLITGVEPAVRDNILAYLRLDDEKCDAPEWRVRRLFIDANREIRNALEVVGFYNAEIEKQLTIGDTCWEANIEISPGQPVRLRHVSIEIDMGDSHDAELDKVVNQCALHVGDVLQHASYEACRRRIARVAESRGYFAAEFTARRIDVFPQAYAADIHLHFKTGPRYVFGEITFDQSVLDADLIHRFVIITPGEPYDAERVRRLQRYLVTSAYFDQVVLTRNPRGAPDFDVPIHIELTPGKKFQYNAGIGFATDVGPKLRFGVLNRRVNPGGHQTEFELNLSRVISDVGVTYRIPLDKPKDWFTMDTGFKYEDNDSFESKLFTAGVQRVQERDDAWIRTLFLNLRLEEYETSEIDQDRSRLLTPGISYAFVEEDYPPRPLEGHRTTGQLRGAIEGLISDTSFGQVYGNTKWVFKLWSSGRLLTRAEAGFTLIDELDTLPASVRFFAGGDTSVRGYAYKSLGPVDPFGNVVGGENLLVGSIEVDQQFADSWAVAAFIDSGNAYDKFSSFDTATGVGVGIRWFSPLGPIRIDVAVPLQDDAPDDYRLHITLGPDL
ncbi:MAG: outer membrane protein assembly factor [Thiotrichales bacterium]|nr:MAG: outer membrane protein assembly factor [Thiotrichales bacterium]